MTKYIVEYYIKTFSKWLVIGFDDETSANFFANRLLGDDDICDISVDKVTI